METCQAAKTPRGTKTRLSQKELNFQQVLFVELLLDSCEAKMSQQSLTRSFDSSLGTENTPILVERR